MRLILLFFAVLAVIAIYRSGHGPTFGQYVVTEAMFIDDVMALHDSSGDVRLQFVVGPKVPVTYDRALADRIRVLERDEIIRVMYRLKRTGLVLRGDTTWDQPSTYEVIALEYPRPVP